MGRCRQDGSEPYKLPPKTGLIAATGWETIRVRLHGSATPLPHVEHLAVWSWHGARDTASENGDSPSLESSMPFKLQRSRARAFRAQSGRCCYCDVRMWLRDPVELPVTGLPGRRVGYLRCTAEHLLPQAVGGSDHAENIAAACLRCNGTRHKLSSPLEPAAYRQYERHRVKHGDWHPRWVGLRGLLDSGEQPTAEVADREAGGHALEAPLQPTRPLRPD
jgi:HNH endonuclease